MRRCVCGHLEEEHGNVPGAPSSTACGVVIDGVGCGCLAFRHDPEGEPVPDVKIGDEGGGTPDAA